MRLRKNAFIIHIDTTPLKHIKITASYAKVYIFKSIAECKLIF